MWAPSKLCTAGLRRREHQFTGTNGEHGSRQDWDSSRRSRIARLPCGDTVGSWTTPSSRLLDGTTPEIHASGPRSGGGPVPRVGCGPYRVGSLARRIGDVSRRILRSAEPARRPALDSMADLDFPGRADVLPGRRLRRRSVVDASARYRRCVAPDGAAEVTRPGARTAHGVRA